MVKLLAFDFAKMLAHTMVVDRLRLFVFGGLGWDGTACESAHSLDMLPFTDATFGNGCKYPCDHRTFVVGTTAL